MIPPLPVAHPIPGPAMDRALLAVLEEDVPVFDLTSHWLGITDQPGEIQFVPRDNGVLSGAASAARLVELQGGQIQFLQDDGTPLVPGQAVLRAWGPAGMLHRVWKTCLNILEFSSGVASRTRELVDAVHGVKPGCGVFTTRKSIPGSRPWAIQAVLDGGGMPHRLGLSETVLIFDQHRAFFADSGALADFIAREKGSVCEKKIILEAENLKDALAFARAGVDGLQFDKIPASSLESWICQLRDQGFRGICLAAGGVTAANAASYAQAGVDGVATSWVYHGPSKDMGTRISPR